MSAALWLQVVWEGWLNAGKLFVISTFESAVLHSKVRKILLNLIRFAPSAIKPKHIKSNAPGRTKKGAVVVSKKMSMKANRHSTPPAISSQPRFKVAVAA